MFLGSFECTMFQLVQMKIKLNKILVEKYRFLQLQTKFFNVDKKCLNLRIRKKNEKKQKNGKNGKKSVGKKKEKGKTYSNIYKFKHMKSYLIPNEYDGKKRSMFHAFSLMLMIEVGCLCHAQTPN